MLDLLQKLNIEKATDILAQSISRENKEADKPEKIEKKLLNTAYPFQYYATSHYAVAIVAVFAAFY